MCREFGSRSAFIWPVSLILFVSKKELHMLICSYVAELKSNIVFLVSKLVWTDELGGCSIWSKSIRACCTHGPMNKRGSMLSKQPDVNDQQAQAYLRIHRIDAVQLMILYPLLSSCWLSHSSWKNVLIWLGDFHHHLSYLFVPRVKIG
jgi:hypothetical protein